MNHPKLNNSRRNLFRKFCNEYQDDNDQMDIDHDDNDNGLTNFIHLCLKHKQHFMLETTSDGKIRIHFVYTSMKFTSIDEAMMWLDQTINIV